MKNVLEIPVNNGRLLHLSFESEKLVVLTLDKGEIERADSFTEGDIVMMINWAVYQKENGNPELNF